MTDFTSPTIFSQFLMNQLTEAQQLVDESDLLEMTAIDPQHILVTFYCRGLIKTENGVEYAERFDVGFTFNDQYLDFANSADVITLLAPVNAFMANARAPFLCCGEVRPGTPLVELIYRVHEVLTWSNFAVEEHKALNAEACQWSRRHLDRLPTDVRPLKYRTGRAEIETDAMRIEVLS